MDMHIISFQYLRADAWVYLNGRLVNKVTSSNPYIDISCILGQKIRSRLSIAVQRGDDQPSGQISLLEGVSINDWCLSAFDETRLYQLSEQLQPESKEITLPYPLKPGQVALLYGTFESDPAETVGIEAIIGGKNIKITAFLNGRLISRLWLHSANRPPMVGGEDNVIFLPGPWMASGLNKLSLMVECISINESGELTEFKL